MANLPALSPSDQLTLSWQQKLKIQAGVASGQVGDPLKRYMTVQDGVNAGVISAPESDNILTRPPTSATDYGIPSPPSSLVLTSGTVDILTGSDGTLISRIRAAWGASNDPLVEGYDVEYKLTSSSDWLPSPGTTSRTETTTYISPVKDGDVYDAQVRSYNAGLKKSSWLTVTSHLVIGKVAPPPDMTGFVAAQNGAVAVFRWNQVLPAAVPDYQGAEIRYGKRGASSWASAAALTRITKGTAITSAEIPPGDWTCYIRAVDTSNNYSLNDATDDLQFINTLNVILQSEQSPVWPGTLTNFLVHWTGVLTPQSTKAANLHTNAELFEQFVPYPFATCSYEAPEISIGFDNNVRIWADIIATPGRGVAPVQHDGHLFIDSRTSVGSYSGYQEWSIGNRTGKFFKFRVDFHPAHGKTYVSSFRPVVDSQERSEEGANLAVSAGGTLVTFGTPFNKLPFVSTPNFTVGGALRNAVADQITVAGFTARIYDSNGVSVAGVLPTWRAVGV